MSATLLDNVSRVPSSLVAELTREQIEAARQAVTSGEAIDLDGLRYVPDVLLIEVVANHHRPPITARLSWSVAGDELDARAVWVYRAPAPELDREPTY